MKAQKAKMKGNEAAKMEGNKGPKGYEAWRTL